MFYVSGAKIYLATFDTELKVYPEVKLVRIDHDQLGVVKSGGGLSQKPKAYSVCSLAEVLAQFGGTVAPAAMPKSGGGKLDKDDSVEE